MFEYSSVAVEVWIQILDAVIDVPWVLDTMLDTDRDYWTNSRRYHDYDGLYLESERQRKQLGLVCHSWYQFAQRRKFRWITYNSSTLAISPEQKEALEAIAQCKSGSSNDSDTRQERNIMSWPRRLLVHINNDVDMQVFRMMVNSNLLIKVTTLFIESLEGYDDEVFDYLLAQAAKAKVPKVACLALRAPKSHPAPLRAISTAFPHLITLTINNKAHMNYYPRENDRLILPDLEILELDLSAFRVGTLPTWNLSGLIHLRTPILKRLDQDQAFNIHLEPIRSLGANLIFLSIYKVDTATILPQEFWSWCPRLVELVAFFSWIYFDTIAPIDHPLKYIVHWPHYDAVDNGLAGAGATVLLAPESQKRAPLVLHNLQMLPGGVEQVVVWRKWQDYSGVLGPLYNSEEQDGILRRMHEICVERGIQIVDQDKVLLRDYLVDTTQSTVYIDIGSWSPSPPPDVL